MIYNYTYVSTWYRLWKLFFSGADMRARALLGE